MYSIEFEQEAFEEMAALKAFHRNQILEAIDQQLRFEPMRTTRRKKEIRGLLPPWNQVGPIWQLRVGDYRVFYDVFEHPSKTVVVRAVLRKEAHQTTEQMFSKK